MLIAIEGADGSGKSTQVDLLGKRLGAEGHPALTVSFPRYDEPVFGSLIRGFLNGDLGDVDSVDPRLVALLFACDRSGAAPGLREALCEDRIVVCDRYFYSNLTYQAAKLPSDEVSEFVRWLHELEFGYFAVPAPSCSIYLDVRQRERRARVLARARLQQQQQTNGAVPEDIHERDSRLQQRVAELFRSCAQTDADLVMVSCEEAGEALDPPAVHERIWDVLSTRGLPARSSTPSRRGG